MQGTQEKLSDCESDEEHPGESEVEREIRKEALCREKLILAKEKYGQNHERVAFWSLKLVDFLIPQYKLNETEVILDEIMPFCKESGGTNLIKAIQSKAFNLFKQYKFKESLACFHEQEQLVGPSPLLYENLAHVYNSVGNYDQAAKYFTLANSLIDQSSGSKKGGILLGLGLVKERQGRPEEALPILKEALDHYKKEVGSDDGGSIIAKAHMSVGQCHEMLKQLPEAAEHVEAAVVIFTKTTGTSPLTANSLGVLGRILLAQGKETEAEPRILQSLEMEVDKDAFHLETVWKLLNMLKDIATGGKLGLDLPGLHRLCERYIPPIVRAKGRIESPEIRTNASFDKGTAAVLYKTAGELVMLSGNYQQAVTFFVEAVKLLQAVEGFDCRGLIDSCKSSMRFCMGHGAPDTAGSPKPDQ